MCSPVWVGASPLCKGMVLLHYLRCSDGVSCSTSCYMWGSWYIPMFLLRDGSFTHMYMIFFILLVTLYDSLPTMVKHSKFTRCPVGWLHWWIGDGALKCSLSVSPKVLPDSSVFFWAVPVRALEPVYYTQFFLFMVSLSLGAMSKVWMVLLPLKCTCMPSTDYLSNSTTLIHRNACYECMVGLLLQLTIELGTVMFLNLLYW